MQIEIITIGDELLIGQVIDTNSAWIAQQLLPIGFKVRWRTAIGDKAEDLIAAFDQAFSRADIILVTGGLGPTRDDITKHTLCRYFNTQLVHSDEVLTCIESLLSRRGITLNDSTRAQALVPQSCQVLLNEVGTASGMWFEQPQDAIRPNKVLISIPGVPYEMKWLMEHHIIPRLEAHFPERAITRYHTIYVERLPESALSEHLSSFEDQLPAMLSLAYLPQSGLVRLRLSATHKDKELLASTLAQQFALLKSLLQGYILTESDTPIDHLIADLLTHKGLTLATAESCTGGAIAAKLTAREGASSYFRGGMVVYSNEAKENLLGVSHQTLIDHGAVSAQTVEEMARGAQERLQADCAIAISGIAGPSGGTPSKPVGTIWVAVAYKEHIQVDLIYGSKSRINNIERATNYSLLQLKQLIEAHQ